MFLPCDQAEHPPSETELPRALLKDVAAAVLQLLRDANLRASLTYQARQTALANPMDKVANHLEHALSATADFFASYSSPSKVLLATQALMNAPIDVAGDLL